MLASALTLFPRLSQNRDFTAIKPHVCSSGSYFIPFILLCLCHRCLCHQVWVGNLLLQLLLHLLRNFCFSLCKKLQNSNVKARSHLSRLRKAAMPESPYQALPAVSGLMLASACKLIQGSAVCLSFQSLKKKKKPDITQPRVNHDTSSAVLYC